MSRFSSKNLAAFAASLHGRFSVGVGPVQKILSRTSLSPNRRSFMRHSGHSLFHFGIGLEWSEILRLIVIIMIIMAEIVAMIMSALVHTPNSCLSSVYDGSDGVP